MLAVDASSAGQVAGGLIPLALGIALIVLGVRRRQAAAGPHPAGGWSYAGSAPEPAPAAVADPAAPSWTPRPEAPETDTAPPGPPPVEPAPRRSRGLIAAGALLIALSLVGTAVRMVSRPGNEQRIALPSSVLGLARDQAASTQSGQQALARVSAGLSDPQAAVYGTLPEALLVITAKARASQPGGQIEDFGEGIQKSGTRLGATRDVDPGALGGAARCWDATIGAMHPNVCVFVDRRWLVATIDFLGGGLSAAAKRGLQVRLATVHTS